MALEVREFIQNKQVSTKYSNDCIQKHALNYTIATLPKVSMGEPKSSRSTNNGQEKQIRGQKNIKVHYLTVLQTPLASKVFSKSVPGSTSLLNQLITCDRRSIKKQRFRPKLEYSSLKTQEVAASTSGRTTPKMTKRDGLSPLKRFKRAARLVKLLVHVVNACRDLLVYAIKDEQWYEFCDKFLKDANAGGTPEAKKSFTATFKNPATKQIEIIDFDKCRFRKDYHSGSTLLTDEVKNMLSKKPGTRTLREIEDCIHFLKKIVPPFRSHTYEQQKRICQYVMYDKYFQERVILRENLPPDGIYYVLNGTLLETSEKMSQPRLIKPGEKFGEEDLKAGIARQSNVVSKTPVDLLYLHKFDYEEIFELTVDISGNEESIFDVCKNDLLFQYYPISELIENPGTWKVLKYKYGRLIAANSCDTEFIYIIRSGEARVIKFLETRTINVLQRRSKLQEELDTSDPYSSRKKLLEFVSEHGLRSYPLLLDRQDKSSTTSSAVTRIKNITTVLHSNRKSFSLSAQKNPDFLPDIQVTKETDAQRMKIFHNDDNDDANIEQILNENNSNDSSMRRFEKSRAMTAPPPAYKHAVTKRPVTSKPDIQLKEEEVDIYRKKKNDKINRSVPPFVQIDLLQSGGFFGMRALLDSDKKGEPASLVSGGCEVIQINKKFFAKYLDETMKCIIEFKAKVYPTEEELLKRLDMSIQWQEYCTDVMCGYLDYK